MPLIKDPLPFEYTPFFSTTEALTNRGTVRFNTPPLFQLSIEIPRELAVHMKNQGNAKLGQA